MTDSPYPEPAAELVMRDLDTLKVYFDPVRTRIMQLLTNEPRTVQTVAAMLNVPFTRLYYQFNLLEKYGLIRVVDVRTLSGAVEEKYYQVTARLFTVDRALLTMGDEETKQRSLDVLLNAVLSDTASDIRASVRQGAIDMHKQSPDPDSLLIRRGIFKMSPERARRFHEKIRTLVMETYAEQSGEEEGSYAFAFAFYPSVFTQLPPDDPTPD